MNISEKIILRSISYAIFPAILLVLGALVAAQSAGEDYSAFGYFYAYPFALGLSYCFAWYQITRKTADVTIMLLLGLILNLIADWVLLVTTKTYWSAVFMHTAVMLYIFGRTQETDKKKLGKIIAKKLKQDNKL